MSMNRFHEVSYVFDTNESRLARLKQQAGHIARALSPAMRKALLSRQGGERTIIALRRRGLVSTSHPADEHSPSWSLTLLGWRVASELRNGVEARHG